MYIILLFGDIDNLNNLDLFVYVILLLYDLKLIRIIFFLILCNYFYINFFLELDRFLLNDYYK